VILDYILISELIWCIWDKHGLNTVKSSSYICFSSIGEAKERRKRQSGPFGLNFAFVYFIFLVLNISEKFGTPLSKRSQKASRGTSGTNHFMAGKKLRERGKNWPNKRIMCTSNMFWIPRKIWYATTVYRQTSLG